MKPRLFPAMLAVAAAIVAPAIAGATEVLSNGSLRVEIRSDNGAIDTVALAGADYFNPGSPISDWGLQLGTDTASFRLNTTTGSTGFPMTVAVDGATVRASGVYEAGGARVRIVREYSLVASVNALLVASTLRNDGASPVTVRYFDTFDPDQGLVLGYGFDTFNDVYTLGGATAAKAVSVNGHAYVLRSLTAGAVLASGSPFNISGGSVLNSVFSSPYDANGARVDSGQHVVYSVTLAPGASEAISTLHAFGTTLGAAEAAATSVCGNGSVEAEQCDDGDLDDGDGCSHDCRVETGFDCPGAPSACVPVHGDGLVVGGEECDDANLDPGDGCSPAGVEEGGFDCSGTPSFCGGICGDGTVVGEETCDDGDLDGGDGCSSSCAQEAGYTCTGAPSLCLSTCGDGIPVGSEACDDGDLDDGDGCSDNCVEEATFDCSGAPSVCITHCGDGIVDVDEDCDDDARVDGDGCTSTCTLEDGWACTGTPSTCTAVCGDGVLLGDEQCDDGNLEVGDCCSAACDFEPSGESCLAAAIDVPLSSWFAGPFQPLTAGWEFEVRSDSIVTAVGVADCTGAGPVQAHTVAIWDDGADLVFSTTVPAGSSSPSFGGFRYVPVPPLLLEAGHRYVVAALYPQGGGDCVAIGAPGDFDPRLRFLAGREIFTLAGLSYPTAPNTYRFGPNLLLESARGDGLIDIDEECDDGNVDEDDGCNGDGRIEFGYDCAGEPSTCAPTCGDGEVAGDESCDDGDATGGDGCSSACVIEAGFTCVSQPSVCTDSCGDGVIDGGEVCDDGNLVDRDGCSSGCTIDPNFSCSGAPSVCSSECGDGVIDSQEQCDDGNLLDGDCCSSLCLYEPTGPACRTALSGASGGGGGGGVTKMEGWEFTVSAPLTISAVGVYDEPSAAGLAEPHEVGIWDSAQNLLGTATVPAGTEADLLGDFRFVPFPALELTPGEHYTIAALYPAPQNDTVLGTMTFTLDPRVSVVTGRRLPFISSLVFPTDLNVNARIGPTFLMSLTDCGNGSLDADETCDDGDLDPSDGCSEECLAFCPATPRDDCRLAAVSQVSLRDDVTDSKDAFKWKWGKGEATSATEVSDPTDSARYQLCLYPDGDLAGTIQPPPGALWESDGDDGYKYADKAKANGGVQQLRILTRGAGKASVSVKAGGDSLPDSLLPSNSYSVQLIDPNSGICWGSDFPSGKLGDGKFSAKVQP